MRVLVDRPMTIGEIADRAVTAAVQRRRALAVLILIGSLPGAIIRLVTHAVDTPATTAVYEVAETLVGALTYAAIVYGVTQPARTTAMTLMRAVRGRYLQSLWTLVVSTACIMATAGIFVGVAALAVQRVPGAALLFVAGAAVCGPPLILYASLIYPVAVLDGVGARTALVRSARMMRTQRPWRTWRLGAALLAAAVVPLMIGDAVVSGFIRAIPALWWLDAVREITDDALLVGFGMTFAVFCFADLRARAHGADLEAHLDAAPHPSSSVSPTAISPGVSTSQ